MAGELRWQPCRGGYRAACGVQLQGAAFVWRFAGGWCWSLDMLPLDAEPIIRGQDVHATREAAMDAAQAQAEAWPVLVRDGRR